jgi:hypothetical protein
VKSTVYIRYWVIDVATKTAKPVGARRSYAESEARSEMQRTGHVQLVVDAVSYSAVVVRENRRTGT